MQEDIMKRSCLILCVAVFIALLPAAIFGAGRSSSASGERQNASKANFNAEGYPVVKEKITQSVFSVKAPIQGDWEAMPFWTEMEKLTNIHFTFDLVSPDALQERKNLLLASGDYPDIFYGANITGDEELTYGTQGIFIKLNALIDQYAPNIKKFFDEHQTYRGMINASDGNMYTIPRIEEAPRSTIASKLWVNNIWLKNLNLSVPKNLDEYYDMLTAFRDNDPNQNGRKDEIPLSFSKTQLGQTRAAILAALGVMSNTDPFDADANGKVFFIYNSDAYREYLTYMNRLYMEKLLDNESFTQTDGQYVAKGNQTLIGSFANLASYIVDTMEHYTWYTAIPPMVSGRNTKQVWPSAYPIHFGAFAITDKNDLPEAAIRWLDYCFTYEGGAMLSQGPEGLGWRYVDSERYMWDKNPVPTGFTSTEEYRGALTPNCGTNTPGYISQDFLLGLAAPHVVNLEEQVKVYLPFRKDSFPIVKLTVAEQKEAAVLSTDINKYVEQMEARFITGDASLGTWDNYVRDLANMKVQRLTEIYQAAYNRFLGK
jgi:putative aldouronate transport system substrate-binding protein